jgi:hypothetical protein
VESGKKMKTNYTITKQKYLKVIKPCLNLAINRNKRYGNSIDIIKDDTIIDLVLMKLIRTRELPKNDSKRLDEVVDSINYLVYLLIRSDKK